MGYLHRLMKTYLLLYPLVYNSTICRLIVIPILQYHAVTSAFVWPTIDTPPLFSYYCTMPLMICSSVT